MTTTLITIDAGDLGEIEFLLHADYQPHECQTHWEPGCDEEATITDVTWPDGSPLGVRLKTIVDRLIKSDKRRFEQYVLDYIREARESV